MVFAYLYAQLILNSENKSTKNWEEINSKLKNLARFLYILLVSLIKNKIIMKPFNLEEYLANPTKKVVTRDGRNVRIICTDRKGTDFPIVGLVTTRD